MRGVQASTAHLVPVAHVEGGAQTRPKPRLDTEKYLNFKKGFCYCKRPRQSCLCTHSLPVFKLELMSTWLSTWLGLRGWAHPPITGRVRGKRAGGPPDGGGDSRVVDPFCQSTLCHPGRLGVGRSAPGVYPNCVLFSICACHPCAGAMLIWVYPGL